MKIKTGQGTITIGILIAIYSISMVTSLPGLAISPILGKLESIFKDASDLQLQMLESLPSFIIVPFILLAGRLSLRMNKKKLLVSGLGIFFACSLVYPFLNGMGGLLFVSALLGIGAGLVIPFSTGLVADYFTGSYRTRQLGYISAITNLTLVLATLLSGFLAGISWHLSFLVYCISGVSLFFSFYLDNKPVHNPTGTSPAEKTAAPAAKPRTLSLKVNWPVQLMIFYYIITFIVLTIPFNLALYMHDLKIGNYDTSGTLISIFFLSMTAPGFFINQILTRLKNYTNTTSLSIITIGMLLFCFKGGIVPLTIGVILIGLGYGTMQPLIYDKTAATVEPTHATYALSLVMAMNYIAIITYPFIIEWLGKLFSDNSSYFPYIFNMFIGLGFTVVAYLRRHHPTLG